MVRLIPASNGEDASPLHEFNPCHAPSTGQFCSGSGAAGSMPVEHTADGRRISALVDPTQKGGISIHLRAGTTALGLITLDRIQPGKLARVDNARLKSELRGKGWGTWLYRRAAELAIAHGATGIWSPGSARNPNSDRVWVSLTRKGLAEEMTSGGRSIYRMPPARKKLREFNACHSPDDGKFCSGPDRDSKIARIKELKSELRPLLASQEQRGGLTSAQAQQFEAKMGEFHSLRYDISKPLNAEKIPSSEERKSTLSNETILVAHADLRRNKDIYLAVAKAADGVHYGKTTAVDDIMEGRNPRVSPEQFYENFAASRAALRAQYGDTMTLYRATGRQIAKATQNWATTYEFAAQFGSKVVKRKIPIDAIIALNVGITGTYHELIVNSKVVRESLREFNSCHSPKDGKFCSGDNKTPDVEGFVKALGIKHQQITSNSIWEYVDTPRGQAGLSIKNLYDGKTVEIHWLHAQKRGSGRAAMERIVELADKHGVTLTGWAAPLPGQGESEGFKLSRTRLEKFYRGFGFKVKERDTYGFGYIVRKPRA